MTATFPPHSHPCKRVQTRNFSSINTRKTKKRECNSPSGSSPRLKAAVETHSRPIYSCGLYYAIARPGNNEGTSARMRASRRRHHHQGGAAVAPRTQKGRVIFAFFFFSSFCFSNYAEREALWTFLKCLKGQPDLFRLTRVPRGLKG